MNKSISKVGIVLLGQLKNISRSANAVQCHNWLLGTKDCHEFRFSIVRTDRTVITVITVSNVTSLKIVKIAKIVLKIVIKNCHQKLLSKIVQNLSDQVSQKSQVSRVTLQCCQKYKWLNEWVWVTRSLVGLFWIAKNIKISAGNLFKFCCRVSSEPKSPSPINWQLKPFLYLYCKAQRK